MEEGGGRGGGKMLKSRWNRKGRRRCLSPSSTFSFLAIFSPFPPEDFLYSREGRFVPRKRKADKMLFFRRVKEKEGKSNACRERRK